MFELKGRVALVTGAGRNIGAGIARALAAQGAAVAVNDFFPDRAEAVAGEIRSTGGKAIAVPADVTDFSAVTRMVNEARSALGPIDILVNNAGIPATGMTPVKFRKMPIEEWDKYLKVNLYGVLYCVKAVLDSMCERRWGRIITISSEGYRAGAGGMGICLYSAGKAGAVGFSKQLSSEVGRFGVTVNCIALAVMDTFPEAKRAAAGYSIPRPGTPEDAAAAVIYLASEEASWITGQVIPLNGGHITA